MSKIETLSAVYVKLRERKQAAQAKFDEEDRALKRAMDDVERQLRAAMKDAGTEQVRNEHGLFTRRNDRLYMAEDWQKFYDHIRDSNNFGLLQKRVGKGAIVEFIEENDGALPPGITFKDVEKLNFTKPKS